MAKTSVIITLSSLLFVCSCAELRYAAASFRSARKVAPTIKNREIVVIMLSSDAEEDTKRFISDLHALGYNVKGDITSSYDAQKNKSVEDKYKQVLACGRNAEAEVVIMVEMRWLSRYSLVRSDSTHHYFEPNPPRSQIEIDILDVTKSKWMVFGNLVGVDEGKFHDALIKTFK